MANSTITKGLLVQSLKDLVQEIPLEKITIENICQRHNMNRKSFYYHFKDKYDLLKYIFQTEFIQSNPLEKSDRRAHIHNLCGYLYDNRDFYHHVLRPHQHNYFRLYFYETIQNFVEEGVEVILPPEKKDDFHVLFLTDGLVCSIERWIMDYKPIPPEDFVEKLFMLLESIGLKAYQDKQRQEGN